MTAVDPHAFAKTVARRWTLAVILAAGCERAAERAPANDAALPAKQSSPPVDSGPLDPEAIAALEYLADVAHPPPAGDEKQFCKSLRPLHRAAATCSRCVDAIVRALPHVTESMNQGGCWLKDLQRVQPPREDLCEALSAVMQRDAPDVSDYAFRALAAQGESGGTQTRAMLDWSLAKMRTFDDESSTLLVADVEAVEAILPLLGPAEVQEVAAAATELAGRANALADGTSDEGLKRRRLDIADAAKKLTRPH